MAEILYKYNDNDKIEQDVNYPIRWLTKDDYAIFTEHLKLCGQKELNLYVWDKIYADGTKYAGLFIGDVMVARAAVEKYSKTAWEVSDVRTVKDYRNRGFAYQTCEFVLKYICNNNIMPTMRTEDDNYKMQRIIERLGFVKL